MGAFQGKIKLVIRLVLDDGVTEFSVVRPSHVTTLTPPSFSFLLGHVMNRHKSGKPIEKPFHLHVLKMILFLEMAFY